MTTQESFVEMLKNQKKQVELGQTTEFIHKKTQELLLEMKKWLKPVKDKKLLSVRTLYGLDKQITFIKLVSPTKIEIMIRPCKEKIVGAQGRIDFRCDAFPELKQMVFLSLKGNWFIRSCEENYPFTKEEFFGILGKIFSCDEV
jgi:hypothetical protein